MDLNFKWGYNFLGLLRLFYCVLRTFQQGEILWICKSAFSNDYGVILKKTKFWNGKSLACVEIKFSFQMNIKHGLRKFEFKLFPLKSELQLNRN